VNGRHLVSFVYSHLMANWIRRYLKVDLGYFTPPIEDVRFESRLDANVGYLTSYPQLGCNDISNIQSTKPTLKMNSDGLVSGADLYRDSRGSRYG